MKEVYCRNTFSIQPSVRFSYNISLSKKDTTRFIVTPFVGYYIFGGKSDTEPNGYKDVYLFNSVEAGFIPSIKICNLFQVGVGIKGQYVFSVKQKYYGVLNQPDSVPRKWETFDASEFYYSHAFNAGLQVKYHIKKITISAEGWFGLSNLFSIKSQYVDVRTTENNYRLMVGYNF
ncbi:hypothetical protein BH11BAC7_BH11BAC7_11410 [soil metagenome]